MLVAHEGVGAVPGYASVLTDRLLVIRVHLRTGSTQEALGVIFRAGSFTAGRAIGQIGAPPAERGFAVPQGPGLRLCTRPRSRGRS